MDTRAEVRLRSHPKESSSQDSSLHDNNNNNSTRTQAKSRHQNGNTKQSILDKKLDVDIDGWHLIEADDSRPESLTDMDKNNETPKLADEVQSSSKIIEPQDELSPRLAYLCTAIYSLMPLASVVATFTLFGLLFTRFYYVTVIYFVYLWADRRTFNCGGRRLNFVHKSIFWSYLASYFPIRLRYSKNLHLDPKKNYILNYHPHGISAFGAVTAFATNGLKFDELFPGITARFMVHETSFVMPVMKETFAFRGDCSVNSQSIDYILSGKMSGAETGNLLTIVVGGLAEADLSNEEILKVVIAERKGFVKKALIHGADILPCIAFGENSVFTKVNHKVGSLLHRFESLWYNLFKFKHPIYYGTSIMSHELKGVMPYKRQITVVIGDPIHIDKNCNPDQKDIDNAHNAYISELKKLYEANKDLCRVYDKYLQIL